MRKVIFGVLITIVLVGGILLVDRSMRVNRDVPTASDDAGKVLPGSIKFLNFSSKESLTFNKFSGKVVLINFWASWCEACMAEMPSIQRLYATLKDKGFEVVAINVDDSPEKVVPQVVSKLHLTFPIYTDSDGELSKEFQVAAIPFSVVADRQQKIVWSEAGEREWDSEKTITEIRKLLDSKI